MADSATTKIAPSVLASDFGQLSAECTRIIKDGADWLHMGESHFSTVKMSVLSVCCRCNGWVGEAADSVEAES